MQRFIQRTNESLSRKHLPMLNSLFVERFSEFNPYSKDTTFKGFMKWARKSPAMMGFLGVIATDMLSDQIDFKPFDDESDVSKALEAKAFWSLNKGLEVAEETLYDLFVTGVGYNWKGKLNELQMKEHFKDSLGELNNKLEGKELEFKAEEMISLLKSKSPDKLVKKLRHVASSTMSINSDKYDITGYVQRVGGHTEKFDVDDIIEFRLMPFDGKIYPFPPMECIMAEVYLLWLITQNYVSFFENGGKPDNVFILPKEIAGSKNHEYLIDTLRKYKKIQNKHGNLVFTGDLTVEKMSAVEDQMENKDLGLYLVSVIAMMYGIPVSRLPFLIGKAATSGDSGGLADSGYWRKISVWQSKMEEGYNRELWIPYFGVEMKFKRGYLQDEVRESANDMTKTQVAEQRIALGLWSVEAAGDYLDVDADEIKKAQEQKKQRDQEARDNEIKSGMLMQNMENKNNVMKEPDAKNKAKKKQTTQNNNQKNAGGKKINP
ncbi:MAG: phage portal protein [Candidatus Heimdallarchaeaceae archaeon]